MRVIKLSSDEKIDVCNKCYTAFAYTKEDVLIYYTEWQDTDPKGEHPQHEIRFKRRYIICPNCGANNHLMTSSQLRKKGSKLYDND